MGLGKEWELWEGSCLPLQRKLPRPASRTGLRATRYLLRKLPLAQTTSRRQLDADNWKNTSPSAIICASRILAVFMLAQTRKLRSHALRSCGREDTHGAVRSGCSVSPVAVGERR